MSDTVLPNESETMYSEVGSNPARHYAVVTPHDTVDLSPPARSLRIGGAGDVTVINYRGASVLFANCYEGEVLPCWVRRVMDTGTDATNIVAFYG